MNESLAYVPRRKRAFGRLATNVEPGRAGEYARLAVELAEIRGARATRSIPAHNWHMKKWADRAKLRGFGLRDFPQES